MSSTSASLELSALSMLMPRDAAAYNRQSLCNRQPAAVQLHDAEQPEASLPLLTAFSMCILTLHPACLDPSFAIWNVTAARCAWFVRSPQFVFHRSKALSLRLSNVIAS